MPMIEEMEVTGNWLFRWRSYLSLVAVVLLLAGLEQYAYPFGSHRWDQVWELLCLVIFCAALVFFLLIRMLRRFTNILKDVGNRVGEPQLGNTAGSTTPVGV